MGIGPRKDPESYWIHANRVPEGLGLAGARFWLHDTWPVHLSEKNWVHIEDFIAAFLFACERWGVQSPHMPEVLAIAREQAARVAESERAREADIKAGRRHKFQPIRINAL
jgi:hypothetical protein